MATNKESEEKKKKIEELISQIQQERQKAYQQVSDKIDELISQMDFHDEPGGFWDDEVLDDGKLKGPQESETSPATKESEEDKSLEPTKPPSETTVAEEIDEETDEEFDGETDEEIDGETGEEIDGETGEEIDGETGEEIDGETGEEIDGETGEEIDGEADEEIDEEADEEIDEEADEEIDEETDEEIDEKKEDDGCRSLQEEFAKLLNIPLRYAMMVGRFKESVSCSISPCLTEDGDYLCTNALHIWIELRKARLFRGPIDAGLAVVINMDDTDYNGMIERRVVCGPGYLKLKLSMKWIAQSIFKMIKGDIAAWAPKLPVKKAIIYFLPPNIAEDMHTGHLRSTFIGEMLARVLKYSGVEVIRRFHEGDDLDVKLKMMTEFIIERSLKGKINDQAIGELEVLYKESKKRFDEDAEFRDRAQQSQGWDETHEKAWLQISKMSREHYQEVYQRLGVRVEEVSCFDPFYKIGLYISTTLDLLREKGLTVESEEDKAVLIEGRKLPLVDFTALWHALNMVKADWIVHVTDVGQRDYFETCIIAAKRAGWIVNDLSTCPIRHVGFGLVQADHFDRFQTRSTEVVSLVNLFEEAKSRCKAILEGQAEKLEHTAEGLGYDAVKYGVLRANRLANYTINFDEMLNEKMEEVKELMLKNSEERELGLHILRFTEVLEEVCKVLMPHILCEYLYDLCKKFDKMYSSVCQVLDPNDKSKLLLCEATARVMRKCFEFLGITPIYKEIFRPPLVAETAIRVPFSDLTTEPLLKEPPATEPDIVVFFSDLTEEQLMALFCKGPCFRFELCNVLLKHNIDDTVENGGGYDELRLFGNIRAENHISDPSHYGSINIFKRNFDDPLVFNNPGSLSPHDIRYCSLSVSTFVKITAEVYGTTYKGEGMESFIDYRKWYSDIWKLNEERAKCKYIVGLQESLGIIPNLKMSKADMYIEDDAFEVCDDNAFINILDYFANKPNGGSGSCKLKGKDGYIELYYVALKYAVEATLEVDFAATSEETKVTGRVMAYYGKNFCYGCCPTEKDLYSAMLFETEPDSDIFVKPGKIDLTRPVLAVPAQYSLIIDANLCDFASGDIILSGVWEFLVPTDGRVCNGLIEGNGCSLKLKVDWKLPPDVFGVQLR